MEFIRWRQCLGCELAQVFSVARISCLTTVSVFDKNIIIVRSNGFQQGCGISASSNAVMCDDAFFGWTEQSYWPSDAGASPTKCHGSRGEGRAQVLAWPRSCAATCAWLSTPVVVS